MSCRRKEEELGEDAWRLSHPRGRGEECCLERSAWSLNPNLGGEEDRTLKLLQQRRLQLQLQLQLRRVVRRQQCPASERQQKKGLKGCLRRRCLASEWQQT